MAFEMNVAEDRDNRGRFVKGHKPLIRPKYELMKQYPALLCATCYKNRICPDYRKQYVCAYKREFNKFPTRNVNDVIDELRTTTGESFSNMRFAMIQEVISGEYEPNLTRAIKKNFKRLFLLYRIYEQLENGKPPNQKQTGILDRLFNFETPIKNTGEILT